MQAEYQPCMDGQWVPRTDGCVQGQIDDAVAQGARVIAGGVKESGVGREGGRCSMDDYTELKWLTFQTKGRW